MTPVVLFVLLLAMGAIPPGAAQNPINDTFEDVSQIIEQVNRNITRGLMDGDIRISRKKNADWCTYGRCRWPKYGRYVYVGVDISKSYSSWQRRIIINGLVSFHRSTCVRFYWRGRYTRNYIYFYPGAGCWSYVGRQGRRQLISLQRNGCLFLGTVQHEVLHALGFHHEQKRYDRDRYVTINYGNIRPGQTHNFRRIWTNNLYTPYDYNSVMHYSRYAFSRNGRPTIVAKGNPNRILGARSMSRTDILRVNRLFRCY